jgi:putative adhesin
MYRSARPITEIAAILVLGLGLSGCDIAVDGHGGLGVELSAGKAQDEWTRSYSVTPGARLEIININGRITAEPTDGQSVEVRAERTAKALSDDSARELLGKIEMREEVGPDRVRVEVRAPRFSGPSSHEIKWSVKVPRGVAVDLRTVNGGVRLDRLEGEVRARSTNGGIVGEALKASSVDAAVTNGGIEINLASAPTSGTIELESVNGGVTLSLPPTVKADITARCVNGGISIDGVDVEVVGEQTRRRLDGKINGGGGARISMETVNGGVKIRSVDAARDSS